MKANLLSLLFVLIFFNLAYAQGWQVSIETTMPEPVSNNAVCEGILNGTPYVYSFTGIGAGKTHADIHLKSWRYNTLSKAWETLPNVPDTLGKIAAGASRVGDTIYIIGGYHVLADEREISSNKVHRFDIQQNKFISDGTPCPIGIDDQVQTVYQDSLIYVITGWSNTQNVNKTFLYHPKTDFWEEATSVPNNNSYKSFGASGAILDDTIFYYGGASGGFGFPSQFFLRKGVINPNNPKEVSWSISSPNNKLFAYRSACLRLSNQIHWLGGSQITYNYNGLAYNNNQIVPNANRDLILENGQLKQLFYNELNMDYRGLANFGDGSIYLAGGMDTLAAISGKTLKLTWNVNQVGLKKVVANQELRFYPNPITSLLYFQKPLTSEAHIFNAQGFLIQSIPKKSTNVNLTNLPAGLYILKNQSHSYFVTKYE